jgi:hypothetical protein
MSDADYELWAAMMADDEVAAPAPVIPVVAPEVVPEPEVVSPYNDETHVFVPFQQIELPPQVFEPDAPTQTFVPSVVDLEDEEEPEFPTNLFKEPQTNSITVQEIPDALTADIVTESGEVLKTGAIDMPILSNTGSIPIITITPDAVDEEAINAAMGDETTGGIPPIRSGSVMNSSARVAVLPIKNRRSEGQTILLATTSILLVAIGAGLIALYMLKLI